MVKTAKVLPIDSLYEKWYNAGASDAMCQAVVGLAQEGFPGEHIAEMLGITYDDVLMFLSLFAEED